LLFLFFRNKIDFFFEKKILHPLHSLKLHNWKVIYGLFHFDYEIYAHMFNRINSSEKKNKEFRINYEFVESPIGI
jgi:hypothetical protein